MNPDVPQNRSQTLPFGSEFQGSLLRLLLEGGSFSHGIAEHIKPEYFTNEALAWSWKWSLWYRETYSALPSLLVLQDQASRLPSVGPLYATALDKVRQQRVTDEPWLRDQTLDFVQRQIFRRAFTDAHALFNGGKVESAYDLMQQRMTELQSVSWGNPDRQWLMEEFGDRHAARQDGARQQEIIGTGIPQLDKILDGGAHPGFTGVWLAHPKRGKTTFLINLGATALRTFGKKVMHFSLEGGGKYIADRYDTIFLDEFYTNVRAGDVDSKKYAQAYAEMQMLRQHAVVRNFGGDREWDYNAIHIENELLDLKQVYGWVPDIILLDYCDLLKGRPGRQYSSETAEQKASFSDIKTLSNRGFAVWTASQVQRPKDAQFDYKEDILKSRDIADCYAKIRIADFIGSINQTLPEKDSGVMRLYPELFRDGDCGAAPILVGANFQKMQIGFAVPQVGTSSHTVASPAIGYGRAKGPPPADASYGFVQMSGVR